MRFYSRYLAPGCLLLGAILAGCAGGGHGPGQGLGRLTKNARVLEAPVELQAAPNLCGVAALDMLTGYYGRPLKAGELEGLKDEAAATDGISGATLKAVLEEAGYFVAVFAGTLGREESGLYHHLDLKRPLIVMTRKQPRHYWVAVGYDETAGMLVLLDPASGKLAMPTADFMPAWKEANFFTLLAIPSAE